MCVLRQQAAFVVITLRQERAVALEIVLIHGGGRALTGSGNGARLGAEREARTQPGVEVMIAERLLERGKRGLASAVARRDVRHFEGVAQGSNDLLDLFVLGYHEMEPAGDKMDARIDLRRGFHDLIDARMRAAHHHHHALGRVDGKRQLAQFQRSGFVGDQCDQMDTGGDLGVLVDQLEVGAGPRGTEVHHFRWCAVIVSLLWRERRVLTIEGAGQVSAIDAEALLGRIDFYPGIHAQEIGHAAHVIAVAVRHDDEVELGQVDALGLRILRQKVGVVAGVEQNALAGILDERGIAPVLLHRGKLAEGVIEHGDLRLARVSARRRGWRSRRGASCEKHGQC